MKKYHLKSLLNSWFFFNCEISSTKQRDSQNQEKYKQFWLFSQLAKKNSQ
jgi:hypothetical protein